MLVQESVLLPSTKNSVHFRYTRNMLTKMPDVRLMARLISGKNLVSRQWLQMPCCAHGGQVLRSDIALELVNGLNFVVNGVMTHPDKKTVLKLLNKLFKQGVG